MHVQERFRRFLKKRLKSLWFAGLTYRPGMRFLLNACDVPSRLVFSEFKHLPPNSLRCRVGINGKIINNQIMHLTHGMSLWYFIFANGYANLKSNIVEIGCGCGRRTHHMRDMDISGARYTGSYTGIDVDQELLDWCAANFDDRFSFHRSTQQTSAYDSEEAASASYRLPVDDDSQDLVFATSVLTHLLEPELKNYFDESFRVLGSSGTMVMTFKAIDLHSDRRGNTYQHRIGNAYVENKEIPEVAVAYESGFLKQTALDIGFDSVDILSGDKDVQHLIVAHKA